MDESGWGKGSREGKIKGRPQDRQKPLMRLHLFGVTGVRMVPLAIQVSGFPQCF
jgi:hypothetical protein